MNSFLLLLASFPLSLLVFLLSNIVILLIEDMPSDFFSVSNRWKSGIAGLVALLIFVLVMEFHLVDTKDSSQGKFLIILGMIALIGTLIFIFQIMRVIGFKLIMLLLNVLKFEPNNIDSWADKEEGSVGAAALLSCMTTFLILYLGFVQPIICAILPAIFVLFSGPIYSL